MSKPVYAIVLVLALVVAYAASHASTIQSAAQDPQTTGPKQQQPAPGQITPPVTSATPSNQVGSGSQTPAGAAPAQTPTPSEVQTPQETPAASNADLQTQIQAAMQKEPTLANDSVNVSVSDDTITLAGTVANNREKQTAMRIAQSYAINKKVVSHLTVSGHANSESKPGNNPDRVSNPQGQTGNPATNPEPNKGKPETGRPPQ